ncbi:polysaccharide deacetylase family protein [Vibrio mediterranei]|uniref:Polysaccharide deacetylase n=1 Tax=Vibrio mediterranei TaxID=689 RepID=A0A3G4V8W4_9VIBR|nr:polysaccharide deacetylase family protein [Vibrio mediterranei]AYV21226.1 polysaccharide deacetylase [Vibrio mediterranei]
MIALIRNKSYLQAFNIVFGALCRSFSSSNVAIKDINDDLKDYSIIVLVGDHTQTEVNFNGKKVIIFGALPEQLKKKFEVKNVNGFDFSDLRSAEADTYTHSSSPAKVEFLPRPEKEFNFDFSKPTQRYDFMAEWNNLDYGFIDHNESDWSVASLCLSGSDAAIAYVSDAKGNKLSYLSLFESESKCVLWVNRNVGLCDAHEWVLIENYVSDYRSQDLDCLPALMDIPWGFDAAITMRLDCDEDVTSAKSLYEAYKSKGIPLSLALHTSILDAGSHDEFIQRFIEEGGAILSHTHTHAPVWGGSYESALFEAKTSKAFIQDRFGIDVEFAVTPFHHAPRYALEALKDAGYKGCVGGIVMNDPEFIYARGGKVDNLEPFVGHTQQVMLHGDCIVNSEDPIAIYKESFDRAYQSQSFFGYLDHPFSKRYTYGWSNETQRQDIHLEFIDYIKNKARNPLFTDQVNALNFICDKSNVIFEKTARGYVGKVDRLTNQQNLLPYFRYKGQDIKVELG